MSADLLQQLQDLRGQLEETKRLNAFIQRDADRKVLMAEAKFHFATMLKGYATAYDVLPESVKIESISSLIESALNNEDAQVYKDENGRIGLQRKDGTTLLQPNHKPVTPEMFLENLLTENRLIVSKDDEQSGETGKEQQQPSAPPKYSHLKELVKKSQTDYQKCIEFSPLNPG